jgi:uncharacterized protein (TIRG00374 family)
LNKKVLSWFLRIGITAGLFIVLFTRVLNVEKALGELVGLSIAWLLLAVVVQSAAVYASILRWDLLLRGQGFIIPHRDVISTFLIGRFFGTFLPGTIGLDAYRAFDIGRQAKAGTQSLAVIVVEKLTGFFALSLLVLFTLPAGARFLPPTALLIIFLAFCVPVTVAFVLLLEPRIVMRVLDLPFPFKRKIEGQLRQAAEAVTIYRAHKGLLALAVLCAMGNHICTTLMYFCTSRAIGAPVALADILFAAPLMIVGTVVLPSIGGEGIREFSLIGLLAQIGVPRESAFVLSNLGFWVNLSLSLVGGLLYLLRPLSQRPAIRWARTAPPASPPAPEITSVQPLTPVDSRE